MSEIKFVPKNQEELMVTAIFNNEQLFEAYQDNLMKELKNKKKLLIQESAQLKGLDKANEETDNEDEEAIESFV